MIWVISILHFRFGQLNNHIERNKNSKDNDIY